MKKILLSLAAATLLCSSCHKDDDDNYVSNTWTVNGVLHNVVNSGRAIGNNNVFVNDGNGTAGSALTFFFAGAPVNGTYKIVDYPTQPNEIGILVQEGSLLNAYRSTSNDARTVLVGVDGTRATIYLEAADLVGVVPGTEGATVTASIREQN